MLSRGQEDISERALRETGIPSIPKGAVLMVVRGLILNRKVPVALTMCDVTVNQDIRALIPNIRTDAMYLKMQLDGLNQPLLDMVEESGHGTKRLPSERWLNVTIPLPPLQEQLHLVSRVDDELRGINSVIDRQLHRVELVREHSVRLIRDVVTGKVDVRHLAPEQVDDDLEEIEALAEGDDGDESLDADGEPEMMNSESDGDS